MTSGRNENLPPVMPGRRTMILASTGTLLLGGLSAMGMGMGMGRLSAARTLRPSAEPVPRRYFGIHIHRADTSTPWPSVAFGSWRLWDAYASWPQLEPQRGQWDFKRLDKYVAMAGLTGIELLLPLGLSPAWASARPDETSAYRPGNAAEPAKLEDWRNYVRKVAERYKGRIRNYELWNEPNLKNFYSGSVETMVALAREAYVILKQVDTANQLAAPATTEGGKQLDWLDRYLSLGGGNYLDVLSHHFYVPREAPEAMIEVMDDIRAIMARHNLAHKQVWNTETGWWFDKPVASSTFTSWKKLKPEEAVAYVSRALILGWAAGMKRFYWYSWEHGNMGLVEGDHFVLNDAGRAYKQTQAWIEGAVMTGCTLSEGRWVCTLQRGDMTTRIAWRVSGQEKAWHLPVAWQVRDSVSLSGVRHSLDASDPVVYLGEMPILLRS